MDTWEINRAGLLTPLHLRVLLSYCFEITINHRDLLELDTIHLLNILQITHEEERTHFCSVMQPDFTTAKKQADGVEMDFETVTSESKRAARKTSVIVF